MDNPILQTRPVWRGPFPKPCPYCPTCPAASPLSCRNLTPFPGRCRKLLRAYWTDGMPEGDAWDGMLLGAHPLLAETFAVRRMVPICMARMKAEMTLPVLKQCSVRQVSEWGFPVFDDMVYGCRWAVSPLLPRSLRSVATSTRSSSERWKKSVAVVSKARASSRRRSKVWRPCHRQHSARWRAAFRASSTNRSARYSACRCCMSCKATTL